MSRTDDATPNRTDTQAPGDPAAPEPVAPADYDGHAEGSISEADQNEMPVGGLEETREGEDDGLGPVNEDEDEPGIPVIDAMVAPS